MRWLAPPSITGSEMPWPFSRNEPDPADKDTGEGNGRRTQARDPAAELRTQTRRRLLGAAGLLVAAVIVLPMVLDSTPRPVRDDVSITIASPPPARQPAEHAPTADDKPAESSPSPKDAAPPAAEAPGKIGKAPLAAAPPPPVQQAQSSAAPASPVQPPAAPVPPPAAAVVPADRFAVQVAALSSAAAAGELVARLRKGGFSAYVEPVSTADSTLHRVRVGPFPGREEAQRTAEKLKAAGHKATVVGG